MSSIWNWYSSGLIASQQLYIVQKYWLPRICPYILYLTLLQRTCKSILVLISKAGPNQQAFFKIIVEQQIFVKTNYPLKPLFSQSSF